MNLVVYRLTQISSCTPDPAGWGLGTGLNLDISPLFAKFTKVKHAYAVASSLGHSQILSRSRGEKSPLQDKIWEWPGDAATYAAHQGKREQVSMVSVYRPGGSKIALVRLTSTCGRVRTLACTQKLGGCGGMLPQENFLNSML